MFHVVLLNGFILNCFSVMCVNRMMFYICVTVHLLYISIYLSWHGNVHLRKSEIYQSNRHQKLDMTLIWCTLKIKHIGIHKGSNFSVGWTWYFSHWKKFPFKLNYSILIKSWLIFVKWISRCLLGYQATTQYVSGYFNIISVCMFIYFNLSI